MTHTWVKRPFASAVKNKEAKAIKIGDVLIYRFPYCDHSGKFNGEYGLAPMIIWGVYCDKNGIIRAFDGMQSTTQMRNIGPSALVLSPKDFRGNKDEKEVAIKAENLFTVSLGNLDFDKGVVAKLKPDFIPDLILRRVFALGTNPETKYLNSTDESKSLIRKGLSFKYDILRLIKTKFTPDLQPPDIKFDKDDENDSYLSARFSQNDIDAITQWGIAFIKLGISFNKLPAKGTWPDWPYLELGGQTIKCCSDNRNQLPNPDHDQKPATDGNGSIRKTAAAQRAKDFGEFKL